MQLSTDTVLASGSVSFGTATASPGLSLVPGAQKWDEELLTGPFGFPSRATIHFLLSVSPPTLVLGDQCHGLSPALPF